MSHDVSEYLTRPLRTQQEVEDACGYQQCPRCYSTGWALSGAVCWHCHGRGYEPKPHLRMGLAGGEKAREIVTAFQAFNNRADTAIRIARMFDAAE